MLFITLGDGSIDPSPRSINQPTDARQPRAPARDMPRARVSPRARPSGSALYGLKQAPQAWYARLKTFLLEQGYVMGSVDKTLFTLNHGTDFLLV
jgi:hypothetical protein